MKLLERCLNYYLQNEAIIWFMAFILSNGGWVIMWFAKTRKYWLEGTEVKKRIEKMEIDGWLEKQINELYIATLGFCRDGKSKVHGRLKIDQQEIRRAFFKEPISLTDEIIISGCWKKILENKNATTDDLGNFYFVGG